MSNSTYLGFPEIVWTAWEAIGTVLAVVVTLSVALRQKIREYLFSPNIKASKPRIWYNRPQPHTNRIGRIQLKWDIHNAPKHWFLGGMAVNLITRFWFDKIEHEGWTYSGNVRPLPILPKNERWTQETELLEGELEETQYRLILVFYQIGLKDKDREQVIGHSELTIEWESQKHML